MLRGQSAGVAHLGDLLQLAGQFKVLTGQLQGLAGQPVLGVEALDAAGDFVPGIAGPAFGLRCLQPGASGQDVRQAHSAVQL